MQLLTYLLWCTWCDYLYSHDLRMRGGQSCLTPKVLADGPLTTN